MRACTLSSVAAENKMSARSCYCAYINRSPVAPHPAVVRNERGSTREAPAGRDVHVLVQEHSLGGDVLDDVLCDGHLVLVHQLQIGERVYNGVRMYA